MESYSGCDTVISRMFRGIGNCYAKTFKKNAFSCCNYLFVCCVFALGEFQHSTMVSLQVLVATL